MPVHDAPTHAKVKVSEATFRYGCHNRPMTKAGYYAPDRLYRPDGSYAEVQRFVPHAMSRECRYVFHTTDLACRGCECPVDTEYLRSYGYV